VRVLTLAATGAMIRSWLIDQDCLLQGAAVTGGNCLISSDPTMTTTTFLLPAAITASFDYFIWLSSGSAAGAISHFPLQIPLVGGRTLFASVTGQVQLFLYLDDMPSPDIAT
jgi:hypothetical protein